MSQDPTKQSFPFLTRDMVDFEGNTTFSLVVESYSDTASRITVRGATKEGVFVYAHTPTNNRLVKVETFRLPNLPIWVSAYDADNLLLPGNTFIRVSLAANNDILHCLFSGYLSSISPLTWPMSDQKPAPPFQGVVTSTNSADPAAGVELSITVPSGEIWVIRGLQFTLVTAAVAATRVVHVLFQLDQNALYEVISPTSQIISLTRLYSCIPTSAGAALADDNDIIIPIPQGITLSRGDTITTSTTNLNAGDNFGVMRVGIERYFAPTL